MRHELEFNYDLSLSGEYCTRATVVVSMLFYDRYDYKVKSIEIYDEDGNEVDQKLIVPAELAQIIKFAETEASLQFYDLFG